MLYQRKVDPSAYLILWQISIAGDTSLAKFSTGVDYRKILLDILSQNYPSEHQVILYEAPTLPIHLPRREQIKLCDLQTAKLNPQTTLVIPPSKNMVVNNVIAQKLTMLAKRNKVIHLCE
jgi:hypothetical protein